MKLNKKVLASLIAAGILTTGTALANPFDDVPKGHWAYDAVQTLADQGVVEGFNDNTFRGDKLMTRYEMAQIVARAMAKNKGVANPTLDKLSAEYADELTSLGVKVDNLEKKTAGVQDLKISHWIQTENSYGGAWKEGTKEVTNWVDQKYKDENGVEHTVKVPVKGEVKTGEYKKSDTHEYELEYRMTVEKQISPKLSALHQLETMTYWDQTHWKDSRTHDSVYSRLAYLTYKPDANTTILAGKNAYWFAGGLLGDDFISGVDMTTKLGNNASLQLMHGHYSENNTAKVSYAGLEGNLGKISLGAHYLTGDNGIVKGGDTNIWAVTAGANLGSGINLALGYAEDTEQDNDNSLMKAQLYKKLGKVDTFAQYWKQEANYNPPIENGCHMAWWGDQYGGNGIEGYRLILGYPVSANCYAEAWYGDYKPTKDVKVDNGKKYGWALTFSY